MKITMQTPIVDIINGVLAARSKVERHEAAQAARAALEERVKAVAEKFRAINGELAKLEASPRFLDLNSEAKGRERSALKDKLLSAAGAQWTAIREEFRGRHQGLLDSSRTTPRPTLDLDEQQLAKLEAIDHRLAVEARMSLLPIEQPALSQSKVFLDLLDDALKGNDAAELEALARLAPVHFKNSGDGLAVFRKLRREVLPVVRLGKEEVARRAAVREQLADLEHTWPGGAALDAMNQACINSGGSSLDLPVPVGE